MIDLDTLRGLRTASIDYEETQALKADFLKLRGERRPFFLTGPELDRVFRWKLRGQYRRQIERRSKTPDAVYRTITEAVFKIVGPNLEYETTLRLGLLMALPGVGVPVASAILALTEPKAYCVIDFRGWRTMFGENRTNFGIKEYLRYRAEVARLAVDLGWPAQEVDLAMWEYDRRRAGRLSA
jgi:hypothetical protein